MTAGTGSSAGRVDVREVVVAHASTAEGAGMTGFAGTDTRGPTVVDAPDARERPRR